MIETLTDEELQIVITIQDVRRAKFCAKGSREVARRYEKKLGRDFKSLIKEGITVEEALSLGDVFFNRLALAAVLKRRG